MPNPKIQAAGEAVPASMTITRRAALCSIASIPAIGGATAATAAIPASEDPWTRARALAAEIKAVLGEIDGVQSVDVSVALDHGDAKILDPSGLRALIEAHQAATAAFVAALDAERSDWNADDEDDPRTVNSDAEQNALCAILEYRPVSRAEATAKVAYLGPFNKRGELDQQVHFDHLLASLLPAGQWLPSEWSGWANEYDIKTEA